MIVNSVRLPHFNDAAESKTVKLDTPSKVIISLSQNIGAPCEPVVQIGDIVKTGQLIGDSDAFVSAPVHSSITGKVASEVTLTNINGKLNRALVIEAADRQEMYEGITPPIIKSREDFIRAVRDSGSVGLGGAGFPTHVKLSYDRNKISIDTLVINGAECEPYISSDYREFIENSDSIIKGIKLIMKYFEIERTIIGIEKDKPTAISEMSKILAKETGITVKALKSKYPQGAEKVLIHTLTGRTVKEGELPMSVGCLVMNSSTVSFLANYVATGIPLIRRRITIDGNIVNKPLNIYVPLGTTLSDIMKYANLRHQPDRVLFGGPMMGNTVYDLDTPIAKTTGSVLFFNNSPSFKASACIRCGRCINVCSMNLAPVMLERAYDARDSAELKKLHINTCLDCGACTYICPAKRNIAEKNQMAKVFLRNNP